MEMFKLGKACWKSPLGMIVAEIEILKLSQIGKYCTGIWPVKAFSDKSKKVEFQHLNMNAGNFDSKLF
ncbi:hypothetical protein PS2_007358 [Malus domestica]